jgi:3-oxoacyl-[acyl-carrier-protein] synthase III
VTSRGAESDEAEFGISIVGVGGHVPTKPISNSDLAATTGLTASEILDRTGIQNRFIVTDGDSASGISAAAAKAALEMAGVDPNRLGLVVGCTYSGDYVFPAMACRVAGLIGARNAGAFDLMANCTGFQVGVSVVADWMRQDSSVEFGLVVGTAVQSPYINWSDPESIYFGDGSGAAILGRVPVGYGVLARDLFTNPVVYESVRLRGGGSSHPMRAENVHDGLQFYEMNGMEVWKQVIQYQPKVIRGALAKIDKTVEDVDFFIFHQANLRLIEYLMARMHQPMDRTYTNVATIGNTADASLALALAGAVTEGLVHRGDLVVISGVGAGFTYGATVLRWY